MKKTMIIMAAALMSLAACTEKIEPANPVTDPETTGGLKYITVNIEEPDTKVGIDKTATSIKFSWENGDIVYLVPNEAGNSTAYEYAYNSGTEKFVATSTTAPANVNGYYAIKNPKNLSVNSGSVKASFSNATTLSIGTFDDVLKYLPMISGVSTSGVYTLHHIFGVLEVPLTISSGTVYLSLTSSMDNYSLGFIKEVTVAPSDAPAPTIVSPLYTQTTISSTLGNFALSTSAKSFYYVIYPGSYSSNYFKLSFSVRNSTTVGEYDFGISKTKALTTEKPLVIERGKITKTSTLTLTPDESPLFAEEPELYPGATGTVVAKKFGDASWAPTYTSSASSIITVIPSTGVYEVPKAYDYTKSCTLKAESGSDKVENTFTLNVGFMFDSGNYWYGSASSSSPGTLNASFADNTDYAITARYESFSGGMRIIPAAAVTDWTTSDATVATLTPGTGANANKATVKFLKNGDVTISYKSNGVLIPVYLTNN